MSGEAIDRGPWCWVPGTASQTLATSKVLDSKICLNLLGYDGGRRGVEAAPSISQGSLALHPPLPSLLPSAFVYSVNVGVWGG